MENEGQDAAGPVSLPDARIANPKLGERWPRARRVMLRVLKVASIGALAGGGILGVVVGSQACSAKAERECADRDGVVTKDIVRIKRIEDGRRLVYTQRPGTLDIDTSVPVCEPHFVADVQEGAPMWGVTSTNMLHEQCKCTMTYHVHSMTDTLVE